MAQNKSQLKCKKKQTISVKDVKCPRCEVRFPVNCNLRKREILRFLAQSTTGPNVEAVGNEKRYVKNASREKALPKTEEMPKRFMSE